MPGLNLPWRDLENLMGDVRVDISLLGASIRLFDHLGTQQIRLETSSVVEPPFAIHLRYRLAR